MRYRKEEKSKQHIRTIPDAKFGAKEIIKKTPVKYKNDGLKKEEKSIPEAMMSCVSIPATPQKTS